MEALTTVEKVEIAAALQGQLTQKRIAFKESGEELSGVFGREQDRINRIIEKLELDK